MVKILIENKADVDALNDDDQSALNIAAARGGHQLFLPRATKLNERTFYF